MNKVNGAFYFPRLIWCILSVVFCATPITFIFKLFIFFFPRFMAVYIIFKIAIYFQFKYYKGKDELNLMAVFPLKFNSVLNWTKVSCWILNWYFIQLHLYWNSFFDKKDIYIAIRSFMLWTVENYTTGKSNNDTF